MATSGDSRPLWQSVPRRGLSRHYTSDGFPKREYPTQELATREAQRLAGKHGRRMNAYFCQLCGQWHIGRQNGGGQQASGMGAR